MGDRKMTIEIKRLKKFYEKHKKSQLVNECILLYQEVQKLGKEKMFIKLKEGLNGRKK